MTRMVWHIRGQSALSSHGFQPRLGTGVIANHFTALGLGWCGRPQAGQLTLTLRCDVRLAPFPGHW